jgi:integrase/recombinase XerC
LLAEYELALESSPLSPSTRRAYGSRIAGYLRWLAGPDIGGSDLGDGDPLSDVRAMNRAVDEFRSWMQTERAVRPTTVNATLTAIDNFYAYLGLGETGASRVAPDNVPPTALCSRELEAFRSAVAFHPSARDRAIALTLVDTGLLTSELVRLDLPDLRLGKPDPHLVVRHGAEERRRIPMSTSARAPLREWLEGRRKWPKGEGSQAVFINRRGERLSTRWITALVVTIGQTAGIDRGVTPVLLRRTYVTRRLATGEDPHRVAELLGHKRLHTTNAYRNPGQSSDR